MVAVNSTMLPLGTKAPDFRLSDPGGKVFSLADFKSAPALLVVFICNHCPYVKHIRNGLARLARDYQPHGVAVVGINANDVDNYPADSPAKQTGLSPPGAAGFVQTEVAGLGRRALYFPGAGRALGGWDTRPLTASEMATL